MGDAVKVALEKGALLRHVESILVRGIAVKWKYDQNDPATCMMAWCARDAYFKDRATPERSPWLTAYDALLGAIGLDAVCDLITYAEKPRTAVQQLKLFREIAGLAEGGSSDHAP